MSRLGIAPAIPYLAVTVTVFDAGPGPIAFTATTRYENVTLLATSSEYDVAPAPC